MSADLVEEMTVMRNNNNRAFKVNKEILKPSDRRNVKVVGRLVHQEYIGITEKSLSKQNLDLDIIIKLTHLSIVKFIGYSKTVEKNFSVALCAPAAHLGKLLLKLADSDSVLLGEILFHIEGFFFVHYLAKVRITHKHRAYNIVFVKGEMILSEDRHSLARGDDDLALVRLDLTRKDFQKSGFACAVRTDQTVAITVRKFEIRSLEQLSSAVLQANINCTYQNCILPDFSVFYLFTRYFTNLYTLLLNP